MEKYFQLPIIVSVIVAVIFLLVIAKVTGFGTSSKKGLTQAQYDALSADNKAKYSFDTATGTYIPK